jgi:hypothetical protein
MTGKEAKEILETILKIKSHLIDNYDRSAFFEMGILCNKLASIVAIDQCSFNPTVKDESI